MIIGTGTLSGRNGYQLDGTFTLTQDAAGNVTFETSDDFFFGNSAGGGTPAPGFAFYVGDPTGLPASIVGAVANDTDFLRIAEDPVSVSGKQEGPVPASINVSDYDTVFLWCFRFPVLLGIGNIERGAADGN